jgi:hypothetical protein
MESEMKTTFRTNIRGAYEGETTVDLGTTSEGRKMQLRISTYKNDSRRLVTHATAVEPTAYGFTFKVFEDFSKVVFNTSPKRITKNLIEDQHEDALEHIDELVLAVQMHYDMVPELA